MKSLKRFCFRVVEVAEEIQVKEGREYVDTAMNQQKKLKEGA